jgi:mono/diheme cytochrome c family protein
MTRSFQIAYAAALLGLVASNACVDDSSAAQTGGRRQVRTQRGQQQAAQSRPTSPRDTVRSPQSAVGFVEHADYIRPGLAGPNPTALRLTNPFEGDRQVVTIGGQLFHSYNCVDCHGMDGAGAMAPSLADGRWRFGGSPSEVFESIYQGRPEGMPAWGGRISDADIWRLVAYVRSLGAGKDVATENFTGKAQQRMGH